MHLNHPKYRLTYEAFSKYSSKLALVSSFEELVEVTNLSLKYFFDFKLLRIFISKKEYSRVVFFLPNKCILQKENLKFCKFEKELKKHKIPIYRELPGAEEFPDALQFDEINYQNPKLWGWFFEYANVQVYLSLVSDDIKKFGVEDLDILRLFVETFSGKYQQLVLRTQLEEKNRNLEKALHEIEKKNFEINNIIAHQKEIIRKRTKSLEEKNLMLLELIAVNSHNLREPLTRILGLLEISGDSDYIELKDVILPYLRESAEDLDKTIQNTIGKSSSVINLRNLD